MRAIIKRNLSTLISSYEEFLLHLGKDHYLDELKTLHKEMRPQCDECDKMKTDDSKLIGHMVIFFLHFTIHFEGLFDHELTKIWSFSNPLPHSPLLWTR